MSVYIPPASDGVCLRECRGIGCLISGAVVKERLCSSTSKSQKPFGPKRSLPVARGRASVSGLCLDEPGIFKTKASPASFLIRRVIRCARRLVSCVLLDLLPLKIITYNFPPHTEGKKEHERILLVSAVFFVLLKAHWLIFKFMC